MRWASAPATPSSAGARWLPRLGAVFQRGAAPAAGLLRQGGRGGPCAACSALRHPPAAPPVASCKPVLSALCQPLPTAACRVWEGQYSSEAHMAQQLAMLRDYVSDPTDWIVAADVDELQDWGGKFIK